MKKGLASDRESVQAQKVKMVLTALENPKYEWRTVKGISQEAGFDPTTVKRVLDKLANNVIRSSVPSNTGESLFTTRRRYRETKSVFSRIGAILRNRAA